MDGFYPDKTLQLELWILLLLVVLEFGKERDWELLAQF